MYNIKLFWLTKKQEEFLNKYRDKFKVWRHEEKKFNMDSGKYDVFVRYSIDDIVWNRFTRTDKKRIYSCFS